MKRLLTLGVSLTLALSSMAAGITLTARQRPAQEVFSEIMRQSGKNFVYSSDLLQGLKITVSAKNESLRAVLDRMFSGTNVTYSIRGNNVMLKRRPAARQQRITLSGYVREAGSGEALIGAFVIDSISHTSAATNGAGFYTMQVPAGTATIKVQYPGYATLREKVSAAKSLKKDFTLKAATDAAGKPTELAEVVITADRNRNIAMETTDVGRLNLTRNDILSTPTVFGEPDVIKTIQLQPGVSAGVEGLAGMYVHGGNHDENLYMLDNVPLYQVNHFGGLFSAFNTEAIKNVDFYKSTFPAKYGGRLSSILEVHTKDGSLKEQHGSARLGLTSGAFNIDGPIVKDRTSFSFAVRRSWFDILTIPAIAIYNAAREDKENNLVAGYAFSDINTKINHHFSDRSELHAMFYYGEDYLRGGNKEDFHDQDNGDTRQSKNINKLRWGNIVGSLGWNYALTPSLFLELTGAVSHYFSRIGQESGEMLKDADDAILFDNNRTFRTKNNITDYTARADFGWNPAQQHRVQFGGSYTFHDFLPQDSYGELYSKNEVVSTTGIRRKIHASEASLYAGDDWTIVPAVRASFGLHAAMFAADGPARFTAEPRAAVRWQINPQWTVKASYARMAQFVHQLTESSISLPTDKWVPISGDLKPQMSDKVAIGGYFDLPAGYTFSVEAYMKWMKNVMDYRDDYFLMPESAPWDILLCQGSGRAKGIDFSATKRAGAFTGHISYSLMWADRQFDLKNGGKRFPSRFDNRHKINITLNWKVNDKWELNAAWTGMSGNMITLSAQNYEVLNTPDMPLIDAYYQETIDLNSELNNFRLPFYHRLDVSANRRTKHGMWTFSLYNAYCNMNVVAIRKNQWASWNDTNNKSSEYCAMRLIPIIPSVSYTWFF